MSELTVLAFGIGYGVIAYSIGFFIGVQSAEDEAEERAEWLRKFGIDPDA